MPSWRLPFINLDLLKGSFTFQGLLIASMSRRLLPVVSFAAFGTGGILGVLIERFENGKKCSYIVPSVKLDSLIADLNLYYGYSFDYRIF